MILNIKILYKEQIFLAILFEDKRQNIDQKEKSCF